MAFGFAAWILALDSGTAWTVFFAASALVTTEVAGAALAVFAAALPEAGAALTESAVFFGSAAFAWGLAVLVAALFEVFTSCLLAV